MIILKNFGRLGNSILQLSNMIDIAIAFKHNVVFESDHTLFNLKIISDYFIIYNNNEIINSEDNFFSKKNLPYSKEIFEENAEERNNLLKEAFLLKNIEKLNEEDLVVHIRSGDIFSKSNPHPNYVPPPLVYYTKQIDKGKYNKIIIICEDKKNPVVNKLLEKYKNAVYEKNTLEKDIRILLGATNVMFSVGTFVPSLIILSDNIKHIYGKKCNNMELENYYKIMKPWKNTKKQREYILTYRF